MLTAQNSRVMYFMDLPQNRFLNPAIRPADSIYIGLPVLTGIGISVNNNFVNFSDVIIKGRSDSLLTFLHPDYDKDKFLSKIKVRNFIEPEIMIQLLGLGFKAGKSYIFLEINERIQSNAVLPGKIFELALKGNAEFVGEYIDLSSLRGDLRYYREFGLGFSRNFTQRFRAGFKAKYLSGIITTSIDNTSLGIMIDQDYSHLFDADLSVNISAPVTIGQDAEGRIDDVQFDNDGFARSVLMRNGMNPGFAFDLGATFEFSDKISLSAAVTDLGFIHWKKDITNLRFNERFEFSGIDLTSVIRGDQTIGEAGDEILDSLENYLDVSESNNPFNTFLPVGISLGGSYQLTRSLSLGILSHSRIIGKQVRESLTLSANLKLGNSLSTTLSYTVTNHRYDNLGAGLAFRLGIVQFYMLSDRIPIMWNRIQMDGSSRGKNIIFVPSNWNTIDLRLGMNLVFGHRRRPRVDECLDLAY